jgi:hypothetical protein
LPSRRIDVWFECPLVADSVEKVCHGFQVEKYALEIEIFALSRGMRAQI